jgi:hypothetical protein
MPYKIRKRPNHPTQAKVYAQDGTPLSKKWLTVKQAEKQKIAVQIGESRQSKGSDSIRRIQISEAKQKAK